MNYFGVFVVCLVYYGVSGFPDAHLDDDKLVIPLKPTTKTKPIEMPRRKMNTKFHQFSKIKPEPEESSNHDSRQSKFSKVQFSSSSFSSRVVSSNGNTHETEASSKFHATSNSNGTTQLNQTEYIAQAKENKTVNGCTENRESVAAVKAVGVATKNPDGSVHTVGTALAESAISHTADGETKRQEVKAATMAETVKDAAGEEHSKVLGLAKAEETKTTNGQNETTKTLAMGESEQVTHGDGKSERTEKFVLLLPDSKEDKSKNNDSTDTEKENNKRENDNQDTLNKKINYKDLNRKPENSSGSSTDDKSRKGSGSLDNPCTEGNSDNKDTKSNVDKSEKGTNKSELNKETEEKETNTNKEKENDTMTQSKDIDSDRKPEEKTGDDEYNKESATSDDKDESDDTDTDSESDTDNDEEDSVATSDDKDETDNTNTDSESDTNNDDEDSLLVSMVETHDMDFIKTGSKNNEDGKNDHSGVSDPTKTEANSKPSQSKRVSELTVTQAGSTSSQ